MSYVDPDEIAREEAQEKARNTETARAADNPSEYPLIQAIDKNGSAIATQLSRIADALEKIAKAQPQMIAVDIDGKPDAKPEVPKTPVVTPAKVPETKAPEVPKTEAPKTEVPAPPVITDALAKTKALFTDDLAALLNFEDKGNQVRIAPKKFLGSDNFAKIASVVRSAGGEYKSAGRNSHFMLPKQ